MSVGDALRKNLEFWHWYPRLLCGGLTEEQLHWQPQNPNHMTFAMWHAFRSEDDIIHGLLMQKPGVFATGGWAERLPVAEPGKPPFGTGLGREQIAAVRLRLDDLLDYAEDRARFGPGVCGWSERRGGRAAGGAPVLRARVTNAGQDEPGRGAELLLHRPHREHLGEVQYIKGLLGLTGAPF